MGEHSIQDAIRQFLNKSKIKGSIQAMRIEEIWEQLMGKTIARYTDKIQIFGNKLIITTQVAPLKQELNYQKEKIMQRVNEALKENIIKEVVIQ
jgi:predicted nucleic acid-binding Zn ribbon protein